MVKNTNIKRQILKSKVAIMGFQEKTKNKTKNSCYITYKPTHFVSCETPKQVGCILDMFSSEESSYTLYSFISHRFSYGYMSLNSRIVHIVN